MTDAAGALPAIDARTAQRFARAALGHVTREYPHKLDHVLDGDDDARTPRQLHPIFHGSFDWHSCVHGYWLLASLLRRFPGLPEAQSIRACLDAAFTPSKVGAECDYLTRASSRGFERPYGWAWLLMLQAELLRHRRQQAGDWALCLHPLAQAFVSRFTDFLPRATYPVRVGTHYNTAFALRLAAEYAQQAGDAALLELLRQTALRWYAADAACQAWEPSGDDFLSSALIEAECMRSLLPAPVFQDWFAGFLPELDRGLPASLFEPATVSDRSDGKIAHLDGLNLSRAWCWRSLAAALPEPRHAGLGLRARRAAGHHLAVSLPHVTGDYMGEHWLASFAWLALAEST
jgi:hypothetical protein